METADMQRALAAREQEDSKDNQTALKETLHPCVDDNKDNSRDIKLMFKRHGYTTMCFSVPKDVQMQKLIEIYCMHQGLDASVTCFSLNEVNFSAKLELLHTFEQAGVTNGSVLHVLA
jgi:hypothetical protein